MGVNRSNTDQYQLRLPPGLRERIKAAADGNGRSMNAEIVSTLEEAFPDPAQFREELRFLDEIDDIQRKLDKLRSVQLSEASQNFSQEFIDANAKKIAGKRRREKPGEEDQ